MDMRGSKFVEHRASSRVDDSHANQDIIQLLEIDRTLASMQYRTYHAQRDRLIFWLCDLHAFGEPDLSDRF
jgi:hypothetical protein